MFVGKGKGENKEFVWRIIFKIFFPKYLVVRRTTRPQFLVVLTHFLVVEDTRIREFCYPGEAKINGLSKLFPVCSVTATAELSGL